MHWRSWLYCVLCIGVVLRLLKMLYNARTRDIYEKNLVQWGCDKKKVNELGDLWRWDLRHVHNSFLAEVREKKAYYAANPEHLSAKAAEYDNQLDVYIVANRYVPKAKRESGLLYQWKQCVQYWKHFV